MGAEAFLTLQIVDFAEGVDDRVAALLQAGTGITLTYNDGAGTLTIANTGLGGKLSLTGGTMTGPINLTSAAGPYTKVLTWSSSSGNYLRNDGNCVSDNFAVETGRQLMINGTYIKIGDTIPIGWTEGTGISGTIDASIRRNATGPSIETRSAGGLRVCDAAGSAFTAVACGAITASGATVIPASTKSAPSLRFGSSSNTGLYGSANGVAPGFGFAVNGVTYLETGDAGSGLRLHSLWGLCWTNGQADGSADSRIIRNATGPSIETRSAGGLRVCDAAGSAFANIILALLFVGTYTVGTLPSASANAGALAQVTDSSVITNGSAVSGSGSNRVMVFSNGTTWDVVVA